MRFFLWLLSLGAEPDLFAVCATNSAQLKAVCVEAGMIALREGAKELNHEHFHGGIMEVAAKKKSDHFVRVFYTAWLPVVACLYVVSCSTLPKPVYGRVAAVADERQIYLL